MWPSASPGVFWSFCVSAEIVPARAWSSSAVVAALTSPRERSMGHEHVAGPMRCMHETSEKEEGGRGRPAALRAEDVGERARTDDAHSPGQERGQDGEGPELPGAPPPSLGYLV